MNALTATTITDFSFFAPDRRTGLKEPVRKLEEKTPSSDEEATRLNAEDVALMRRVGQGDTAAFESLVKRHQDRVIGTVTRMLGDPAEAEDLAQQVFIRVWKAAGRYQPTAKFTTWLFTITRNLVFNESRRRSRRMQVSLEEQEENHGRCFTRVETESPDRELLHDEMTRTIDAAIKELPGNQRMALVLRRFEGLSYGEIGEIMGLTVSSVKSLLFRARIPLREKLKAYLED